MGAGSRLIRAERGTQLHGWRSGRPRPGRGRSAGRRGSRPGPDADGRSRSAIRDDRGGHRGGAKRRYGSGAGRHVHQRFRLDRQEHHAARRRRDGEPGRKREHFERQGHLCRQRHVNIDHFSFSGATVADGNGAGIRFESGNLVLENDYFFNNQNGLLAGSSGAITIRNSEFANNGTGDGYTHNLYVNQLSSLVIDGSYFHDAVIGHEIKSRALSTTIQNSRIQDQNGTASYSIDLPNGGNALIYNNTIEQGPNSDNPIIIDFGEEGGVYSGSALQVTNNLVLNHLGSSSARAINNTVSSVTAQITGNRFFGLTQSQVANGANSQSGNQFLTSEPALVTTHPWLTSVTNDGIDNTVTNNVIDNTVTNDVIDNTVTNNINDNTVTNTVTDNTVTNNVTDNTVKDNVVDNTVITNLGHRRV